jgi:excisionase family DNA binding protein
MNMLTVNEVAERLGCSKSLVYALCEKGILAHVRLGLGRGVIRISEGQLDEFLKCQTKQTAPSRLALKHIELPAPAAAAK